MSQISFVSADEAVSHIKSGSLHFHHFHSEGPAPYSEPHYHNFSI